MKRLTPRLRAFTLIELLIVITIIGILAIALLPRLTGGQSRARDAQRKSDLQQIATALEFYANDNGEYPDVSTNCVSGLTLSSYLTSVPNDPNADGWGGCTTGYAYYKLDDNNDGAIDGYLLVADLETITEIGASGIYNTTYTAPAATLVSASESFSSAANTPKICNSASTTCTSSNGVDRIYVVGR